MNKNKKILILIISLLTIIGLFVGGILIFQSDFKKINIEKKIINDTQNNIITAIANTTTVSGVINNKISKPLSNEGAIGKAFIEKYNKWDEKLLSISFYKIEKQHASGKFIYNNDFGYWFAVKDNDSWVIVDDGFNNYFGICQNFIKYDFPRDLMPDCWDTDEKTLIRSVNLELSNSPELSMSDEENVIKAFLKFKENLGHSSSYAGKKLVLRVYKQVGNYIRSAILSEGEDKIISGHFFAVNHNNNWIVIYHGAEDPFCKNVELYDFPISIVPRCWQKTGVKEELIIR